MKERPILFSGEMVRAILEGRKTQTRRVIKPQPALERDLLEPHNSNAYLFAIKQDVGTTVMLGRKNFCEKFCNHGQPGDRLWVRETWGCPAADHPNVKGGRKPQQGDKIVYRANPSDDCQWGSGKPSQGSFCWRPSIFMPHWASRLTLEIIDVRVQRVQEITEDDAKAEGIDGRFHPDDAKLWTWRDYGTPGRYAYGSMFGPRESYERLWDSLNGKRRFSGGYQEIRGMAWKDNPWVWAIAFRRVK